MSLENILRSEQPRTDTVTCRSNHDMCICALRFSFLCKLNLHFRREAYAGSETYAFPLARHVHTQALGSPIPRTCWRAANGVAALSPPPVLSAFCAALRTCDISAQVQLRV